MPLSENVENCRSQNGLATVARGFLETSSCGTCCSDAIACSGDPRTAFPSPSAIQFLLPQVTALDFRPGAAGKFAFDHIFLAWFLIIV